MSVEQIGQNKELKHREIAIIVETRNYLGKWYFSQATFWAAFQIVFEAGTPFHVQAMTFRSEIAFTNRTATSQNVSEGL